MSRMSKLPPAPLLANAGGDADGIRVVQPDEDSRGYAAVALRDFPAGATLFAEPPLALSDASQDPPWMAEMRAALTTVSADCAWQYCLAARCLAPEELPHPWPPGLEPLPLDRRQKLQELCGGCGGDGAEPTELASLAAERLLAACEAEAARLGVELRWSSAVTSADAGGAGPIADRQTPEAPSQDLPSADEAQPPRAQRLRRLADRLDDVAGRASRNGFSLIRPSADGVFHRMSYFNHCCAGLNNAAWSWNGASGMLTCRTTCEVLAGEELTISYIAKPWCDLATRARRRYLLSHYNFVCLCKACCRPPGAPPLGPAEATAKSSVDGAAGRSKAATDGPPASKLAAFLSRWLRDDGAGEAADSDGHDEAPEAAAEASGAGAGTGGGASEKVVASTFE